MKHHLVALSVALISVWSLPIPAQAATYSITATSKKEAVKKAWKKYCNAGYCEGYRGWIVGHNNWDKLYVSINSNRRTIRFGVSRMNSP